MNSVLVFLVFISLIITIWALSIRKKTDEDNKIIEKELEDLLKNRDTLFNQIFELSSQRERLDSKNNSLIKDIETNKKDLELIQETINKTLKNEKQISREAFESYCEVLEKEYQEKENEYRLLESQLQQAYNDKQSAEMATLKELESQLKKLEATRIAVIEAARREKEIKEQTDFYCLQISNEEKSDIIRLQELRNTFNHPRVISKLIWSDFIQKQLKTLSANVLGTEDVVCGVYKITSTLSGECYIGQSVDIARRFSDHGKCGCGIDAPAANKLYKAMNKDGIWNFSWELLEKCPKEQLDEKEKFYINLYHSDSFGYNSTNGNS